MALPASLVRIVQSMGAPPAQIVGLSVWQLLPEGKRHPIAFVHAAITALQVHQNQNLVDLVLTATWQDSIRKVSAHNATLGTNTTNALQAPTGLCSPGFYCRVGQNASTACNPYSSENMTSDVCPPGSYCPLGTVLPIDCPVGTFNPSEGGTSTAACTTCTAGTYCEGLGNINPDGYCNAGFYCTGGASTPIQHNTEAGYFTTSGASAMTPCSIGTYQDHTAQSVCTTCPAGYYCPTTAMTNVTTTPCPKASVLSSWFSESHFVRYR